MTQSAAAHSSWLVQMLDDTTNCQLGTLEHIQSHSVFYNKAWTTYLDSIQLYGLVLVAFRNK